MGRRGKGGGREGGRGGREGEEGFWRRGDRLSSPSLLVVRPHGMLMRMERRGEEGGREGGREGCDVERKDDGELPHGYCLLEGRAER